MNQKEGPRLVRPEVIKSVAWGLIVTVLLAIAIIAGSRNLSRFDAALVAYTFASLFAALHTVTPCGCNDHRQLYIGGEAGKPSSTGLTGNRMRSTGSSE